MHDKLKEIFNPIQAEEELKNSTREFLAQKTQGYKRRTAARRQYRICSAVCICLLFILTGGRWLYFTPTAEISIDINPSLEMSVNRFDRVIAVNGFQDEGLAFADTFHIKFKNYTDAIEQILSSETIASLLSDNEIMTITVTGPDGTQSSKMLSEIETCTARQENTYCYFARPEEVAKAHDCGLSYGKYRAFLEMRMLDPAITPETVQGMTMREIRDLTEHLSRKNGNDVQTDDNRGCGHRGFGNEHTGRQGGGNKRKGRGEV
ncbi:MAG: hypothetical protein HFE84_09505 [Lachnospiraceae bacterium]|nr:hypothetical protein [Lachnospiraceae bacterium]